MEPAAVSFNSFGRRGEQAYHCCHYGQKKTPVQSTPANSDSPPSAADGKMDAISNLHRFLQHTTPRVPSQFLSKTRRQGLFSQGSESCEKNFFSLSDLWDSFDEWSAYGAGVPILLNGKETVMQYYVPYLSAIQLYSSSASEHTSKIRRRLGDDSDGSEMDYRDSNSETSTSDSELERVSDHASWSSLHAGERIHEGESLLFEYFESAAPSLRVPLFDKVRDLAGKFSGMKTFCSNDLSQSSWLSVAWYPIYRIPTGPTLKDLAACFLTYHSLSTLVTDDSSDMSGTHSQCGTQMALHAFGLAGYKFRGPVWTLAGVTDRHRATLLQRSSHDWLKRLYVRHPDFEYFMSH